MTKHREFKLKWNNKTCSFKRMIIHETPTTLLGFGKMGEIHELKNGEEFHVIEHSALTRLEEQLAVAAEANKLALGVLKDVKEYALSTPCCECDLSVGFFCLDCSIYRAVTDNISKIESMQNGGC